MSKSLYQGLNEISEIKKQAGINKRVVFVSGIFNIVHPGHLRVLRFAAECGDFLVVGVTDNEADGSLVHAEFRLDGVRSIGFVDYAFYLNDSLEAFIRALKPAVVVKGLEHESQFNPERKAVESYGGKLLFTSGETHFSSIDLLKKEMQLSNLSSIIHPNDFLKRHGFTMSDLRATVDKFKNFRVTVLGDLIVDEYITCDPIGMSQEDPTLVVTPIQTERFIGGAGIVAAHAKKLGADVQLFTVTGKDDSGKFALEKLLEYQVKVKIFEDDSRPTTLKQRFRASGKTLLRVSHLRQHDINEKIIKDILKTIKSTLSETDLVIFSDFNYGCLPQTLVDEIVKVCKRKGIMMVADSQCSSQMGDVSRFKDMMLLTPTEREARLAVHDYDSGLVVLAEKLRKKASSNNIIMTLGAEGILAHIALPNNEIVTDRLEAFNTSPKDPAGAGDSLLTCCSMALAVGADIWQGIYLGSIAAACQVSRVGNTPLSSDDIASELVD